MSGIHGAELYQAIVLFIRKNTYAISKNKRPALSKAVHLADYMIKEVKKSNDLMSHAIEFYDPKDLCESHAANVAIFSLKMALDMNLSMEEIRNTVVAALFHDLGLGKVKGSLRSYDGFLGENFISEEDRAAVQLHSQCGYEGLMSEGNMGQQIAEAILQHHEKADGSGYPNRLPESQQLLSARIISIIDTYEALIHPRPYRDALAPPKGMETIIKQKGTTFSAEMIKALLSSLSLYPVGQFVKLNNGVVGKVIKTYAKNPVRPDIEVHFDVLGDRVETPKTVRLSDNHLLAVDHCLPGAGVQDVTVSLSKP
jgi:HD-GYP domain-containing protein (c-di-GMP phosphodiesterase class II)